MELRSLHCVPRSPLLLRWGERCAGDLGPFAPSIIIRAGLTHSILTPECDGCGENRENEMEGQKESEGWLTPARQTDARGLRIIPMLGSLPLPSS